MMMNSLVPLYYRDLIDAMKEQQLEGLMLAAPGVLGVGIQTYKTENKRKSFNREKQNKRESMKRE